jgi:hypothetical protein
LWQLAQPDTMPAWFIAAPENESVLLWHVSQGCVVGTWFAGLPIAAVPLWQLAQPAVTPVWLNLAPEKLTVLLWQLSHGADVAT